MRAERQRGGISAYAHFQRIPGDFIYNRCFFLFPTLHSPPLEVVYSLNPSITGSIFSTMRLPSILSIIFPLLPMSIARPLSLNLPQSASDALFSPFFLHMTNLTKPQGTWHCDHGSFARSQRVHFGDCREAIQTQLPENGPSRQVTTSYR